jgi:hypothetical protein
MFNSPTAYCSRCRQYIALDERRRDCAAVHGCVKELCPLEKYFGASEMSRRRSDKVAVQPQTAEPAGNPAKQIQE